jgi:hypothetical protein
VRKTKIIATIGPASEKVDILKKMIESGMNVARLNFSHGNYEEHRRRIYNLRQADAETKGLLAIMLDTKGPEINLGIFPGAGGTQRFPRSSSICIAKQYIFTGDFFDAATAEKIGLVNMVVPAAEVMDTARKFARKLCRKSPLALREAKQAVNMSMNLDIKSGCRAEQIAWSMLFSSEDQKEGMTAFLENRKADFKGK